MPKDIFRAEAVAARQANWLGVVRLTSPLSHTAWACFVVSVALAIGTWLVLGHYTRRQHVSGVLIPVGGLVNVAAKGPATVASVAVSEGQLVRAGQSLIVLSTERRNETIGDASSALNKELKNQVERLRLDLSDAERLSSLQVRTYRAQRSGLSKQLSLIEEQIQLIGEQINAMSALLEREKPLVKRGYISQVQIQQQEAQAIDLEVQQKSMERQRQDLVQQIQSVSEQIEQASINLTTRSSEIIRQTAQLEQARIQNETDRSQTLVAPQDGVIASVLAEPGQSVNLGQTLLNIIPSNAALEAHLWVPSSAIGFVAPGQSVFLRYQPYAYQKFGVGHGTVRKVSSNALTPTELNALLGGAPTSEGQYRVVVTIANQSVQAYGQSQPLKPGMALDADIFLDRRSFMEWLFEPIYGMKGRI